MRIPDPSDMEIGELYRATFKGVDMMSVYQYGGSGQTKYENQILRGDIVLVLATSVIGTVHVYHLRSRKCGWIRAVRNGDYTKVTSDTNREI